MKNRRSDQNKQSNEKTNYIFVISAKNQFKWYMSLQFIVTKKKLKGPKRYKKNLKDFFGTLK